MSANYHESIATFEDINSNWERMSGGIVYTRDPFHRTSVSLYDNFISGCEMVLK
jgi:hypothetical protein